MRHASLRMLIREMLEGSISDELQDLKTGDQALRNVWAGKTKAAGGRSAIPPEAWERMRSAFVDEHGTALDDFFGDKARHERILALPSKIEKIGWKSLTDADWNNLWLLVQHMDRHPHFQKEMLPIFQKHLGPEHSHVQFLSDRISCRETGTQRWGTQDKETGYKNCKVVPDQGTQKLPGKI